MKISLLFIALMMLVLSACSKSDKDTPAPTFELLGRWHAESSTDRDYDASGKVTRETATTLSPPVVVDITATEFVAYDGGGAVTSRTPYTRAGDVLRMGTAADPSNSSTITELTARRLVLTNPRFGATGTYPGTTTLVFSRP